MPISRSKKSTHIALTVIRRHSGQRWMVAANFAKELHRPSDALALCRKPEFVAREALTWKALTIGVQRIPLAQGPSRASGRSLVGGGWQFTDDGGSAFSVLIQQSGIANGTIEWAAWPSPRRPQLRGNTSQRFPRERSGCPVGRPGSAMSSTAFFDAASRQPRSITLVCH